tara:strand:- start:662 stop:1345 length:684 start_codon:yes stop_codon:yes gene_type:complete
MGSYGGPDIITDELVFVYDAGSTRSYPGSGTTVSNIISGLTGTLANGVAFNSADGGFWELDGTDDYILVSNASSPQFTANQAFTISYVIKLNTISTGSFMAPVMKGSFNSSYGHLINNTDLRVYTDTDSTAEYTFDNVFTNDLDKWVFITQTYDGNIIYLYRNGEFFEQSGTGISFTVNTSNLYLGCNNGSVYFLNGDMANVKMYNKALTAAEVTQNFNSQKSRFGL